ncbi:myosin regulatory light chain, smooth muscle-like isoform X4 [Clavelina lepadiformis]|uniref:myosin regulatory light chain, smooth muscle-like isoform X4 n=1 Tax=Clavelina lepadiformis TaxID=159417 RepID=UPI0040437172
MKKASRKTKKKEGTKQRSQRATSNVFSMFDQSQIQEFKEAFTMIDANRDGFIDKEDLKDTYASLGTDPEEVIVQAFKLLDSDDKGVLNKNVLAELLTTQADRFSKQELQQMFDIAPIDAAGNLDYKSLCYIVTHGQEEE